MTTPMTTVGGVTFLATIDQISGVANQAELTAQEVQAQLGALQTYVEDLDAQWHGVASSTFNNLMAEWNIYAVMLNQALTGISQGLKGNWVNYSQGEESNMAQLKAINANLPVPPGGTIS